MLEESFGTGLDPFDLLCHIAYGSRIFTRRERAELAKRDIRFRDPSSRYGEKARAIVDTLLEKYCEGGLESLEDPAILNVPPFTELGTAMELIRSIGGRAGFDRAVRELEMLIYSTVA